MRQKTTAEFIEDAQQVHGDRYDYSLVEYVNNRTKTKIICREHGGFQQEPSNHLTGRGCPQCATVVRTQKRSSTTETFIAAAVAVHGDLYGYSLTRYVNHHKKVKIICREHGVFQQQPSNHLMGKGCKKCGDEVRAAQKRFTATEFVTKARLVHGDRYNYDSAYNNAVTKVVIVCSVHGEFSQTPSSHLTGCGCPTCAEELKGYYNEQRFKDNPGMATDAGLLYLVEMTTATQMFLKIGITKYTPEQRFHSEPLSVRPIITVHSNLKYLWQLEQTIKGTFDHYRYRPSAKFGGQTECFKPEALLDICEFIDNYENGNDI
jgi:hypothetical protein